MNHIAKYSSSIITFFQNKQKRTPFLFGILAISVILLYISVFNNPFVWDDFYGVVKNKYVHDFRFLDLFSENTYAGAGSIGANWRPLILTMFSVIWHFWGGWTVPYHTASIFLHAINAILVFILFKKLFKRYWPAFLSALLFAIHPMQTQAVVYIAGLGDPLGAFFMLAGTIAYVRSQKGAPEERAYLGLAWICFACALMSKENAVMMPGLLFLADFFSQQKNEPLKRNLKRAVKKIVPFAALFVCYIITRLTFLDFLPKMYGSAFSATPFGEKVLVFFSTITDYIRLLFAPLHLHMEHSVYWVHSFWEPKTFIGTVIIFSFLAAIITQWKRRPEISFGLAWFLIAYSPNSNLFMPTTALFGEHWLYLSLPGLFLAIFCVGGEIFREKRYFPAIMFLLFVWIGWIASVTVNRNLEWETPIGIMEQTHREEPKKVRATIVLGSLYRDNGEYEKALKMYAEAIKLDPNDYMAYSERADLYKKIGNNTAMIADMERSCKITSLYSPSFKSLLKIYKTTGEFDKAEKLLNLQITQGKNPKIALGATIELVSIAVARKDHALVKKYLLMGDKYEKEINKDWSAKLGRWLITR